MNRDRDAAIIKTFEQFKDELKKFNSTIDDSTSKKLFDELSYYNICMIELMPSHWDGYVRCMKMIKEEYRKYYKLLYIHLDYKGHGFVPQDCPYEIAFLDTRDGTVYSSRYVWEKRKEAHEKKILI